MASKGMVRLRSGPEQLVDPGLLTCEIEPAEQRLQPRGPGVLAGRGALGRLVGVGVAAPAVDRGLLLGQNGQEYSFLLWPFGVNQARASTLSCMISSAS